MLRSLLRPIVRRTPFSLVNRHEFQRMQRRCHRQGTRGALDFAKSRGLKASSLIDVGAELGTPAIWSRFPDAAQLLIEPRKECLPALEKHAAACRERGLEVRIENVAVGDVEGVAEFQVAEKGESSSLLTPADKTQAAAVVQVPVKTIDGLLQERPLPGPIFLKVDAEGYDLKVLQGAVNTLPLCSMVMVEGTPRERQAGACRMSELLNFLEGHGFILFDMISLHYDDEQSLDHFDLMFVPKGSPVL
jgi:FkbM family methyltransferase